MIALKSMRLEKLFSQIDLYIFPMKSTRFAPRIDVAQMGI
jgi:hypothetical protein